MGAEHSESGSPKEAASERPWPAASLKEVEARLCAPGELFEMETALIRGVATRVWKNQPPTLAVGARLTREAFGANTFIVYEDERVTYEAWFRAVVALARALQARGVTKGDRVALAMRNLPEWPVVFFAVTSLGAIVVPLNAWWTGPELRYGLAQSGTRMLISDGERWERIRPFAPELPALRDVIVARGGDALAGAAVALESLIGTPNAYAALPDAPLPEVGIEPAFDGLRSDQRFGELLRRVGLSP